MDAASTPKVANNADGTHTVTLVAGTATPFVEVAEMLPETATIDEVAKLYVDAWHLGVKAIAIYRDNCKVAQPLSSSGSESNTATPPVLVRERKRLPLDRTSRQSLRRRRASVSRWRGPSSKPRA